MIHLAGQQLQMPAIHIPVVMYWADERLTIHSTTVSRCTSLSVAESDVQDWVSLLLIHDTKCWNTLWQIQTHTQPFYSSLDFVQDNLGELVPLPEGTFHHLLDFLVQNEDNTGRHTNNLDGLQPIQINWRPISAIPTIVTPDTLPGTTLPIYPGSGQAPNMLACIPGGLVDKFRQRKTK